MAEMKTACPKFSGERKEYKAWRNQVDDWIEIIKLDNKEIELKKLGINLRLSLVGGKAYHVVQGIDRAKLTEPGGYKLILQKLDDTYKDNAAMESYNLLKRYLKIERGSEESVTDYLIRYERVEEELRDMMGDSMLKSDMRAVHVMEQAKIPNEKVQFVVASCGKEPLNYENICEGMKRIFSNMGNKEEGEWFGAEKQQNKRNDSRYIKGEERHESMAEGDGGPSWAMGSYRGRGRGYRSRGRGGRNPTDTQGRVSVCVICSSEWHWARDCPENFRNRSKRKDDVKRGNNERNGEREEVYIGESNWLAEEESYWENVEAILDTGCKSTVCGEI